MVTRVQANDKGSANLAVDGSLGARLPQVAF